MAKILPQPGISQIELYQGGSSHIEGVSNVVKLSSNENPFGPSDAAIEAFRRTSFELHRYPSTDHASLRAAISAEYDLDFERMICGVGSDEIITLLCQAFAGPGDEVIHTEHGFAMYRILPWRLGPRQLRCPSAIVTRMLTQYWPPAASVRAWCFWPTPIIQPAPWWRIAKYSVW